jgi:DHA3 family tetracycline resistance protein-like MFS transporter
VRLQRLSKLDAVWVHWISAFGFGLCMSIIFTLDMVYQVVRVGLNPLQLVLVGTTLESTIFLFEVPTGIVADIYSRRLSVIVGVFLTGLAFLLEGSWPVFGMVLAAQILWGLGWTFMSGARSAWIADQIGVKRLREVLLRATQFSQLGSLMGIPISVALGHVALNLPILVGGGLYLVLGIFMVLFMPETGFAPTPPEERETWAALWGTLRHGVRLVRGRPVLGMLVLVGIFVGLYSEGYDRLWTAHLLQNFSFPSIGALTTETWFGVLRLVGLLVTLGASEVVRRRLARDDVTTPARALQIIYTAMVGGLLILALTRQIGVAFVALWLFGALRHVAYPLMEAWINQHIESRVRATVLSMTSQVDALGQMVGGPLLGAIGTALSLRIALVGAALLLAPVVPLFRRADRRQRRPNLV